ncbi:MAG: hypothetical protein ABSH32_28850, partial [Bryobacteraceae bacterium]
MPSSDRVYRPQSASAPAALRNIFAVIDPLTRLILDLRGPCFGRLRAPGAVKAACVYDGGTRGFPSAWIEHARRAGRHSAPLVDPAIAEATAAAERHRQLARAATGRARVWLAHE